MLVLLCCLLGAAFDLQMAFLLTVRVSVLICFACLPPLEVFLEQSRYVAQQCALHFLAAYSRQSL